MEEDQPMHRESSKHGPAKDDELKHELEATLRGNRPSRSEEWRDPELAADDDVTAPGIDEPR
ncbi:hypothetical protein [Saccharothrix sp. NRRL B-16314]|uniref:hypothetical protein n=1 Tax=Saccharothrix sp. NRRL B-16314 TaxID=1463825 RepID=UPI0005251CAE|nr:hypothetical protein [Saccharothrix sp. NRRL B-16314]